MAKTTDYLALDLGAESGRGMLGRFDGDRLGLEEVPGVVVVRFGIDGDRGHRRDPFLILNAKSEVSVEQTREDPERFVIDRKVVDPRRPVRSQRFLPRHRHVSPLPFRPDTQASAAIRRNRNAGRSSSSA